MRLMWLASLLLLLACGEQIQAPAEPLNIQSSQLTPAVVGEPYAALIQVSGGLAPYSLRLSEGQLPPGMLVEGTSLRGTASEVGSYTFTLIVSDANLSKTFREYSFQVIEPPPPELTLNVPLSEMRQPFLLRASLTNARNLRGFRTQIRFDAERFEVNEDSIRAKRNDLRLLYQLSEDSLQIDAAFVGQALTGEAEPFEFELRPRSASNVEINFRSEYMTDSGQHAYQVQREGRRTLVPSASSVPDIPEGIDTTPLEDSD